MPDNITQIAEPQGVFPRCQFCGTSPAPIMPSFTQIAGARIAVFHCANPACRAVHSVQMIGMDQPASSLVIPGGLQ